MSESLESILSDGLARMGIPFTASALHQFQLYHDYLAECSEHMNLTSIRGEENVARLHLLDCAAILNYIPASSETLLDIGSGAGFPGLVLKILRPELCVTLMDSTGKRVQFQKEVCDLLGLQNVNCLNLRAEEAPPSLRESFDVVTSRAVARLNLLSELCLPFVKVSGMFLAMKGPSAEEELSESQNAFQLLGGSSPVLLQYEVPGLDATRTLVRSEKLFPSPSEYPRRFGQMKKRPL